MFYNYIFYYLYKIVLKTPSHKDAVFMTIIGMVLPLIINVSLLEEMIEYFLDISIMFSTIHLVVFGIFLIIINYLLFMHKDRYIKVIDKIESGVNKVLWNKIMFIYIVLTLGFYFIPAIVTTLSSW